MKKLIAAASVCLFLLLAACGFKKTSVQKEKLLQMNDDEFYEKMYFYCIDTVSGVHDVTASDEEKTLYVLYMLDMEVGNGGLCQFFVNSSSECAPYVSEALEKAGALKIKKLYDDFIAANNIDVNDLSSFIATDYAAYLALTQRYDFDSFDDAFYQVENIRDSIVTYARENIDRILA